jgi:protein-disulfide isomerase
MTANRLRRRLFCAGAGLLALARPACADATPNAATLVRPGDPILGNPHGDLTIVDFYDIRCPPCRTMDRRIDRLLAVDPGIRYVPVDYPILSAASALGARALFAAQAQHKYRQLRHDLMTTDEPPSKSLIETDAKALSLDWPRMALDMNGDAAMARVEGNLSRGRALGIDGIPALYVGDVFVPGELSYGDLVSVVAMARARQLSKPP